MSRQTLPYGSWPSPITTALLTADTVGLSSPCLNGADVYWLESRASEGGRAVLVRRTPDGECTDLTPPPFNVRSRVHEYGGGAFAVRDGIVVFANFADCRLYLLDDSNLARPPRPITPEGGFRYAEPVFDLPGRRLIAVREDHTVADVEPVNTLVSLDLDGTNDDGGTVLHQGTDFVSSADLSDDGHRLTWLTWDHPAMPWDGTTLWVADVAADGALSSSRAVSDGRSWIKQPRWHSDGRLFFIAETAGWANLAYLTPDGPAFVPSTLPTVELEFGGPDWALGGRDYAFLDDGRVLCTWFDRGVGHLGLLDPADGELTDVAGPGVEFESIDIHAGVAVLVTRFATAPTAIMQVSFAADGHSDVLRRSTEADLPTGSISTGEAVVWDNSQSLPVHGFFYPPTNADATVDPDERPPLLVVSHGGPTGMHSSAMSMDVQYWTSRGFAVLDVNYGGSSGFGRAYRERLRGQWGLVDVDDCATGATTLADQGRVDPARLAIRGGSAGGYTTLCALAFTGVFSAGASHYGIGDLEALVQETHKLESRYCDGLIGPYPEARDVYIERSPIHHLDQLSSPMILLQGADDEVVPPNQAEDMAAALRTKGLPVALLVFEGEGHGFRQAANIKRALEAELAFYGRVFGFDPADRIDPIQIDNLP